MQTNKSALILIDIQNDFCPGGSLAVPEGDQIIPVVNQLQMHFETVIASQDWHPANHISFAANHPGTQIGDTILIDHISQILWPVHCVQNTKGAEFHPQLHQTQLQKIFQKGVDKDIDSYSCFFDAAAKRSTGMDHYLKDKNIHTVYLAGLATDYCVKYSALDAAKLGFEVFVIEDACKGVELKQGDCEQAITTLQAANVKIINSLTILQK